MLLYGLRQAIAKQPRLTLVGEAASGAAAGKLAAELSPDLIVMDIHLPDMNGIEVTRRILDVVPAAKVVIFSGDANHSVVDEALQAGACGFVWKKTAVAEVIRAIEIVMAGHLYLSPEVSAHILENYRMGLAETSKPAKPLLSKREIQLLRLVAEGRRTKEIATQLHLTVKSVEAYRSRLMKKLGCSNAIQLVRYAIREGIATA